MSDIQHMWQNFTKTCQPIQWAGLLKWQSLAEASHIHRYITMVKLWGNLTNISAIYTFSLHFLSRLTWELAVPNDIMWEFCLGKCRYDMNGKYPNSYFVTDGNPTRIHIWFPTAVSKTLRRQRFLMPRESFSASWSLQNSMIQFFTLASRQTLGTVWGVY